MKLYKLSVQSLALLGTTAALFFTPGALAQGKRAPTKKPAAQKPLAIPADRDAAAVVVTRAVMADVLAGKQPAALMTPALRAKLTPGKVKSMGASLRGYGPLKKVSLITRKPAPAEGGAEPCTLRVLLGQTTFIASVTLTPDGKLDDLQLLEE